MNGISKWLVDTAFSRISLILSALLLLAAGNSAVADMHRTVVWGMPTIDGVCSKGEWVLTCIQT